MHKQTNKRPLRWVERALVCSVFLICFTGAILLPPELCPDEEARQLLSTWMYQTHTLPTGDELETIIDPWGFSYALRPFLSAMVAALCMGVASVVTTAPLVLLAASRLVSVLSVTICCVYCLRLGHRLFQNDGVAILLATFVCFLPQVLFLGMYQNNDALALAATTAMLYYLVMGSDTNWSYKSCLGLGVSLSVGLLSYYTAYPWFLAGGLYFVLNLLRDRRSTDAHTLLTRLGIVVGTCCVLAGWFFVRNALLHGGDPLGIAWENESRARYAQMGYALHIPNCPKNEGMSFADFYFNDECYWLRLTILSFVAVFGNMDILLPLGLYNIYIAVLFTIPIIYILARRHHQPPSEQRLLLRLMLLATLLSFACHVWLSYARDFQPQGRYVIEIALLLGCMLGYAAEVFLIPLSRTFPQGKHVATTHVATRHVAWPALACSALWILLASRCIPTWQLMLSQATH